jgi:hypothetical protein
LLELRGGESCFARRSKNAGDWLQRDGRVIQGMSRKFDMRNIHGHFQPLCLGNPQG